MRKKSIDTVYKTASEMMAGTSDCVALTGAGISVESGIPAFRSKDGLWVKYDPYIYASIDTFHKDPSKYWTIRGEFIRNYDSYQPNKGHLALMELEKLGILRSVITQNIDGLHRKAGSVNVIEIHGSLREIHCVKCGKEYIAPNVPEANPPYCACGGALKPDTVLFGESLPEDALLNAQYESETCSVMLLIGTSSVVYPAASLPYAAQRNNARIIEINIERSFQSADLYIEEKAGTAIPEILKLLS